MLLGILSSACAAVALATDAGSVPYGLSVEYRKNPVGIDSPAPRLSWKLPDSIGRQTAYEIEADGWKSGKVDSDQSLNVVWKGRSIGTSARIGWRVRVWDEKGTVSDWSRPASFVAGVMDPADWKARWIGPNRIELVSPAFEKRFAVSGKVARATLHVTGVGFYEARLNGVKVGDKVLDPSPTEYRKRVLYSTYLLDEALRQGDNILTILVGHGWYDVRSNCHWKFNQAPWRDVPRTLAQLEIEYADGRREVVVTDGSWQQVASPVAFDCIREGEVVGVPPAAEKGRALLPLPAAEMPAPEGRLAAEAQPGAKVVRTIRPTAIHTSTGGLHVVEFPEDLAGWVRLRLRGQRCGDVVTVRYDERINAGFTPAVRTFGDAHVREARPDPQDRRIDCYFHDPAASDIVLPGGGFQTDRFVCSGAAEETYEPRFTYSGFRYAIISGLRTPPAADDVVACEVRTAFDVTGSFESSDATLNALVRMADRAYRSNFTDGVPTDCPHREKNGWTGDASLVCEMAQYLYENTAGYEKWLEDLLDAQRPKGDLPAIVPTAGWGYDWGTGPVWDSALWVIPWNLYCYRGDRKALERAYPAVKRYLGYLSGRLDKDGLFRGGLGDWVAPDQKKAPSARYVESAYAYQAYQVAACMARRLGLASEAQSHEGRALSVRTALRKRFCHEEGVWDNGSQTAQALALTFGLVEGDAERQAAELALVHAVERKAFHVEVGVVGMKHLFRALSEAGRSDLALKHLLNETAPSPAAWFKRGGTSLWEDWQDGASRNHAMFGDFAAWAYQYLAGIRLAEGGTPAVPDPFEPAFKALTLAPQIVAGLDRVSVSTETPYGTVRSAWCREGEFIRYSCTVPVGTTALLCVPGRAEKVLKPGDHEVRWKEKVTDGWENVNPQRDEGRPAQVVKTVDIRSPDDFTFERRDGAEGWFAVANGRIRLVKTNDKGYLLLKAKPFAAETGRKLRLFADVEAVADNPDCAAGYLCTYGKTEKLGPSNKAGEGHYGGNESMLGFRNSAPGTPYRKYNHFLVEDGTVTPMIIICGTPSVSRWRNWTYEDMDAAQSDWQRLFAEKTAKDNSAARLDEAEFDRRIAADVAHEAEVRTVDGYSRLLIDGKAALPILYLGKDPFGDDALLETFHGNSLEKEGLRLMSRPIEMGGKAGVPRRYWTKGGFDAKGAVADFKDGMRIAPDSLFVIRLSCNAYPEYTAEHPEEVWKTEDGQIVKGTSGSCVIGYDDMGVPDTNRWPWVSYASRRWREDVKANIRALVAEFKRQGLDKRLVGIHISGYHDGQFTAPYPDFSDCAKREYEAYLKERPTYTNYLYFAKQIGFRAQEEFAREFKRALGKKAIAFRWCEAIFTGSEWGNYDFTAFANSDAIDIAVPQPPYERRHPALASGPKLPQGSFHLHGKMFWYENDMRTYGALESWTPSIVSALGLGYQGDVVAWRSAYRKLAGLMMSLRSGFWFYDMGGGWFSPPEIAADIGGSLKTMKSFALRKPATWRPEMAVVVDEANPAVFGDRKDLKLPLRGHLITRAWPYLSSAGVPYESYLAEDVIDRPEAVGHAKIVVLALFRHFDARRIEMVRRLAAQGKTIVFLAESGVAGGDVEATGFKTVFDRGACPHEIVPAEGVTEDCSSILYADYMRVLLTSRFPDGIPIGPRVTVREEPGVRVVARFKSDGAPAVAYRDEGGCRKIYVGDHCGPSAALLNRFAREAGAYVPHAGTGVQVDMNGDFASVHALCTGTYPFRLPYSCAAVNLKSGREESQADGIITLELTAGETCWLRFDER